MIIDQTELDVEYDSSIGAEDLAENFAFFIESVIRPSNHGEFMKTVLSLPPLAKYAYLPYIAKISMDSEGLGGLLSQFDTEQIRKETSEGFDAIGMRHLKTIVDECWTLDETVKDQTMEEIDKVTNDIHERFYRAAEGTANKVGHYLTQNRQKMAEEIASHNERQALA